MNMLKINEKSASRLVFQAVGVLWTVSGQAAQLIALLENALLIGARGFRRYQTAFLSVLVLTVATDVFGLAVGNRIKAAAGGANVRNGTLATVLFTQDGGVHGTITSGPITGTAGGYTGSFWQVTWDSQPPNQGSTQGWSAESVISLAPAAGDVPEPSFTSSAYTAANIFWQGGFAPGSTGPPNPQPGSALGNCTWYAHGRLWELGFNTTQLNAMTGDASRWDEQALAAGIPVDTTPSVGAIAQSDSQDHVAVVESVNSDGTITVTESSYVPSSSSTWDILWRHRTVAPTWFSKFIHVASGSTCTVTLNGPLPGAAVSFPGTFSWTTSGSCQNTHLAFATSSNPSTAQVTGQLSGTGTITTPEWANIANQLGPTSPYYWAVVSMSSDGTTFTALTGWRSFQPVSSVTSITPTPADGANAIINQNFPVRVDVGHELITSGVLQVWIYDADFSTSQMDWKYIPGAESAVVVFNNLSLSRSVSGARDYTIFVQFRPGATSGPLLSSGINDIEQSVYGYTVNWQNPPDTTPPTITITAPTSNPTYSTSSSSVNLGGSASDNVGVTQVTWANDRGGSGTASDLTSWSISGVNLQNGVNTLLFLETQPVPPPGRGEGSQQSAPPTTQCENRDLESSS